MNATHFFSGYFCVAGLYVLSVCATVIWCLARAGGNYLFWVGVGIVLVGYLLAQVWAWYFVCCFFGKIFLKTAHPELVEGSNCAEFSPIVSPKPAHEKPFDKLRVCGIICYLPSRSLSRARRGDKLRVCGQRDLFVRSFLGACRIILSAGLLTGFVFFMERCSLFFFGCCEGVPLFQPLIFLLDSFIVRDAIQLIGAWWTLFFVHGFLSVFCLGRWRVGRVVCLLFFFCLAVSFMVDKKTSVSPPWLARCAVVRPPFVPGGAVDVSAHVQSVAHQLTALEPCRDLIFFPESAFPFPLSDHPSAHAALSSLSVGRTLFLGTHKHFSQRSCNAALCLCNGQELFWHEKTHGMIGLERLPLFLQWGPVMRGLRPLLGDGFFVQAVSPENLALDGCFVCDGLFLVPLICSEFFYCHSAHLLVPETVILALVNDAWFANTSIPDLLWYIARLKSLLWGCGVLYISYRYAGLFDATGSWFIL